MRQKEQRRAKRWDDSNLCGIEHKNAKEKWGSTDELMPDKLHICWTVSVVRDFELSNV